VNSIIQYTHDEEPMPCKAVRNACPAITKQRVHLVVDQRPDAQPLVFPTLVARGRQPGKTLLVIGAVHGDEYEGPVAIQDIFEDLVPTRMRGSFVGIHPSPASEVFVPAVGLWVP
jgi:hypothetical protein